MKLTERVKNEMILAMKAGDKERKETLSLLLGALQLGAKNKMSDLEPVEELAILSKEIKQTKESIDTAPVSRADVITKCSTRLVVLQSFQPTQLTESELKVIVQRVLDDLGIVTPTNKDKGAIMKQLKPIVTGNADGKVVNDVLMSFFN